MRAIWTGLLLAGLAAPAWAQTAATRPNPDSTGPQTAVPAPAPGADTPGGSARGGVIAPPAVNSTIPVIRPDSGSPMPVIKPGEIPPQKP